MIVGADTDQGAAVVAALDADGREVRAFVTSLERGLELRNQGVKVALGDVSDDGHIEAACTDCFSVVLIAEAASDDRERSFGDDPGVILAGWSRAVSNAGVDRAIWVTDSDPPPSPGVVTVVVSPHHPDVADEVARLDDLADL